MDIIALSTIFKDGERYSPGALVHGVDDNEAAAIIAAGLAKEAEAKAEAVAEVKTVKSKAKAGDNEG